MQTYTIEEIKRATQVLQSERDALAKRVGELMEALEGVLSLDVGTYDKGSFKDEVFTKARNAFAGTSFLNNGE